MHPNRLTEAIARVRAAGKSPIDLTVTNPTRVGISYPAEMLSALGSSRGRAYCPQAFGASEAREAVSADYLRRGITVDSARVVLTASTSEAYSFLFKLLCEPSGDRVLTPVPSYPLFDHLTALDGIAATPYELEYHGRWSINWSSLDAAWASSVKAVLAVSPNNPTGSTLSMHELDELSNRCIAHDAALIVDEVFADYSLIAGTEPAVADCRTPLALTFRLGGLSKSAGLPQAKLGWIAVDGPPEIVDDALERLELICDTYLSVSTAVQIAAPALIDHGAEVRRQILHRIRRNHAVLRERVAATPSIDLLHADAGWSAVVRVPSTRPEEDLAIELLERDGVLVHPGFFFDFAHEAFLIVSLLPEPSAFDEGISRMLERSHA